MKLKHIYVSVGRNIKGRTVETKIGTAIENSDGSLSLKFDCLPVGGECIIRDYIAEQDKKS